MKRKNKVIHWKIENKQDGEDEEEEYQLTQQENSIEEVIATNPQTQQTEQLRPQRISKRPPYLADFYFN